MAVLKNVRCNWASVIEPNTKFEPTWEIEAELNDEQAAMFADAGVRLKESDDGIKLLRFKRKVSGNKRGGGTYNNRPPKVVDAHKQPFTKLIGNGSLVNIAYSLKAWEMMGNSGVKADLNAVQVLELVEFNGGGADEFDDIGDTQVVLTSVEDESTDDIF
jgi:hypothetical protein